MTALKVLAAIMMGCVAGYVLVLAWDRSYELPDSPQVVEAREAAARLNK